MWRPAAALVMVVGLAACSPSGGGVSTSDCVTAVRFEGAVYVGAGMSQQGVEQLGQADRASCDDLGPDPRGPWFDGDPEQVSVWSFPGYDAGQVIGLREPGDATQVLVAEDLPDELRRQITSALVDPDGQ